MVSCATVSFSRITLHYGNIKFVAVLQDEHFGEAGLRHEFKSDAKFASNKWKIFVDPSGRAV